MSTLVEGIEGNRLLHPGLNEPIGILAQSEKYLFSNIGTYLCRNSPINFVGSLLVEKHHTELIQELRKTEIPLSDELETPISFRNGLAIKGTPFKAEEVLVKHACGVDSVGIVMSGLLTGLIVDDITEQTCTVSRIFNDAEIPDISRFRPYTPTFTWYDGLDGYEKRQIEGLLKPIEDRFKSIYREFADSVKRNKRPSNALQVSDLFIALCDDLSIYIDKANFHYTIDFLN